MSHPQLYTIPPELPFADTLAAWVLEQYGAQPESLAQVMMLVPSRRACSALQEAFLRVSEGKALLLPRIFPLGLGDEDVDTLLATLLKTGQFDHTKLLPAIAPVQRHFRLAQMIRAQRKEMTVEQAVALGIALGAVLDDFAKEQIPMEKLRDVVREDFSEHWQISLDFLDIVIRDWPAWLVQQGMMDSVERRNVMLLALCECLRDAPPQTPIIAAGTTGSVPATAQLLSVIAGLPQGAVVLPALDMEMSDEVWNMLGATHPQFGMMQLLHKLEVARDGVLMLGGVVEGSAVNLARRRWVDEALMPASATHEWTLDVGDAWLEDAVQGVEWVACESQEQEAFAIALRMREVLETPAKTAMLVTHDRVLARLVAAVMTYYDVEIDDSAGAALWTTPPAVFVRLVLAACESELAPMEMLALLRHPLCGLGLELEQVRRASRQLEVRCLRGTRPDGGLEALKKQAQAFVDVGKMDADVMVVLDALQRLIQPLYDVFVDDKEQPFAAIIALMLDVSAALANTQDESGEERIWSGYAGNQLAVAMSELVEHADELQQIAPRFFTGILEHVMGGVVFRPPFQKHPRLRILSPIEARMQSADVVILGGLNEGVWPASPMSDPWLSRAMRADLNLAEHERTVGQAAHDFYHLMLAPHVMITRPLKVQGSPAIASRWLLRLEARLGGCVAAQKKLASSGDTLKSWLHAWQKPAQVVAVEPPAPCPPSAVRPKQWSVTKIEKLMRDPYSVYADKVLRLRKLEDLDAELNVSDFGNAVHKAFELYYTRYPKMPPENALAEMLLYGREAFAQMLHNVHVQGFWWPRFERIAREVVLEDAKRIAQGRAGVLVEQEYRMAVTLPDGVAKHILTARMDRIEVYDGGKAIVIDYKTGEPPRVDDVNSGVACQLLLECLILSKEAFLGGAVAEYWKTSGAREIFRVRGATGDKAAPSSEEVEAGVSALLSYYALENSAYLSCPSPEDAPKYNDFDYLARRDEWAS